jgi:hypothetical protein
MRWAGHGACMGEKGCPFTILVKKKQVKKQFGRTGHRCVDDIKMGLKKQD